MPPRRSAPTLQQPPSLFEFDFAEDLKDNGYVNVFGIRGRGKTTLARAFLQKMRLAFRGQFVFFVGTEEVKKLWRAVSHPFYVRDPTEHALEELLRLQKEKVEYFNLVGRPFPESLELIIVVDDCGAYPKFLRSAAAKTISVNGRNEHITFICLIQLLTQLHPDSRKNTSTFIGLHTEGSEEIEDIHKLYASSIDRDLFFKIYKSTTRKRQALCLNPLTEDAATDLCGVTHVRWLHPDGPDAIAECELEETMARREREGKRPKKYLKENFLQRLGAQIHFDVAQSNYRTPTLEQLVKSNSLLKFATTQNSFGAPMPVLQKPYAVVVPKKISRKKRNSIQSSLAEMAGVMVVPSPEPEVEYTYFDDDSSSSESDVDMEAIYTTFETSLLGNTPPGVGLCTKEDRMSKKQRAKKTTKKKSK